MNILREFIEYRKFLKSFQEIELTDSQKVKLEAFDKDLLRDISLKVLENLSKEIINDNVSRDYAIGYKHGIAHLLTYFKKYNI